MMLKGSEPYFLNSFPYYISAPGHVRYSMAGAGNEQCLVNGMHVVRFCKCQELHQTLLPEIHEVIDDNKSLTSYEGRMSFCNGFHEDRTRSDNIVSRLCPSSSHLPSPAKYAQFTNFPFNMYGHRFSTGPSEGHSIHLLSFRLLDASAL